MPPKRKVPARRASAAGKRDSFTGSRSIPPHPTTPSGRPRREVAGQLDYKESLRPQNSIVVSKKRAKNAGTTTPVSETPKKRGRPPKSTAATTTNTILPKTTTAIPVKAGRGRPRKSDTTTVNATASPKSSKRKRDVDDASATAPPRKRGRPPKTETSTSAKAVGKLAVKPQKSRAPSKAAPGTKAGTGSKAAVAFAAAPPATPVAKRGRPKGAVNSKLKTSRVLSKKEAADGLVGDYVPSNAQEMDAQYWLMKAEPDSRIEKGVDVAFSIDTLAAASEPEPWDGVRNYVARNNMRAMRKGDLAFFYHSNCAIPAIVGVMRVAEEHSIDESAFDPAHPYFDEKSVREKPRWDCVKVEFVKKFEEPVTLKTVKGTNELSEMQLASKAYGRLSVQKVTPNQWIRILKMAGEPEELGEIPLKSGYEADTDGEADKEPAADSVHIDDTDSNAAKLAAYGGPGDDEDTQDSRFDATANPQTNGVTEPIIDETQQTVSSGDDA